MHDCIEVRECVCLATTFGRISFHFIQLKFLSEVFKTLQYYDNINRKKNTK